MGKRKGVPALMSHEERRKIIEAPMPIITWHSHSRSHAGHMVVDDKVGDKHLSRHGSRQLRVEPIRENE